MAKLETYREPETYREKALKCARAADEANHSSECVGLLGFAIAYMALADYVDGRHELRPVRPVATPQFRCLITPGTDRNNRCHPPGFETMPSAASRHAWAKTVGHPRPHIC
jgi:hypothetical protein